MTFMDIWRKREEEREEVPEVEFVEEAPREIYGEPEVIELEPKVEEERPGILAKLREKLGPESEEEAAARTGAERKMQLTREVYEKREREREIEELREKAEREELRKEVRRYRRQYRPGVPSVAKKLQTIATLGGVPRIRKETRELYLPRAKPGMYAPTGMRRLTSFGEETMQEVTEPRLERLRRAGAPRVGGEMPLAATTVPPTGMVDVRGQGVALGLLRRMTTPKGLMPIEKYAYAEIVGNGDRDTSRHVVSELAALGISRRDAEQAIKALLSKGLVRRTQDFQGEEPVLEITR